MAQIGVFGADSLPVAIQFGTRAWPNQGRRWPLLIDQIHDGGARPGPLFY